MEVKKNPKIDLQKKSGMLLNLGLSISLLMVLVAFEWRSYDDSGLLDLGQVEDDFEDIMNSGKILLLNLAQGKIGEENAALLGAMLITSLQLAAMSRFNVAEDLRRDFYLYVDEFQNFATDSFIKILSEARKYRLNLTLANQYMAQVSQEVEKAIMGNIGNLVSFIVGAGDARILSKEYGDVFTDNDLTALDKYQIAVNFWNQEKSLQGLYLRNLFFFVY